MLNDGFHGLTTPARRRTMAVAVLAVLTATGASIAQSDRDLREENQRLQTQVNDMQRELDAAQARIAELQRQVRTLARRLGQSAGGSSSTGPSTPPPRVSIDESVPNASPRALFRAISESYREATRDMEIGDFDGVLGTRRRTAYLRAVDNWAKRLRREMRSSVHWHIRIMPLAEQGGGQPGLRVLAVDPETHVVLGEPFIIRLNSSVRRKLAQLEQRGALDVLVLKGVLIPQVSINPSRMEPGPFDNPRLIGPFAEFGFAIDASSLVPVPKTRKSGMGSP